MSTIVVVIISVIICGCYGVLGIQFFEVAGVLPQTGYLSSDMMQASNGYQFFCDYLEAQGGFNLTSKGDTFTDENEDVYQFGFSCNIRNNEGDLNLHMQLYDELLANNTADFYVGSHVVFEKNSSVLVNDAQKMIFQCCVGPDSLYEDLDLDYQFGIQASNKRYPELIMKEFGFNDVLNITIIRQADNAFTNSTCQSAADVAKDRGVNVQDIVNFNLGAEDNFSQIVDGFIQETQNLGAQAIVGCVQVDQAEAITRSIDQFEVPLKAVFLTSAPWYTNYIQKFGDLTEYQLSAGQWHWAMQNVDDYFGSNARYVEEYSKYYDGEKPTYVAAGASAVLEAYMFAIQQAFVGCDLTNTFGNTKQLLYNSSALSCKNTPLGTTGYEMIRKSLTSLSMRSFFGQVGFNKYRRNIAMDPATIQIKWNKEQELENMVVLPVDAANTNLELPQPNRYQKDCQPGYKRPSDTFMPCQPCPIGMKRCATCPESDCEFCSRDEYNDEIGQAECKACPSNTRAVESGATNITQCLCSPNYFSPTLAPGEVCLPCEAGGKCDGELEPMYPQKGYWMDPQHRNVVHACSPAHVCKGGKDLACAEGYSGRLCDGCADNYYSVFSSCRTCPKNSIIVIMLACLIVIAWWIINAVISRKMETFDVILNWVQLLSVVGEFDMNWPSSIYTILQLAGLFAFEVDIIELSCIFPDWGFTENFVIQLLMPIGVALMAALSFLATYTIYRMRDAKFGRQLRRIVTFNLERDVSRTQFVWQQTRLLASKVIGTIIMLPKTSEDVQRTLNLSIAVSMSFVSISYLTLVKYSFDAFKCVEISGELVMKNSVDIKCGSDIHDLIRVLGVIGIVVYVFAFPVFAQITLSYLRKQKAFHEKGLLERFGWLYHRYEVEWYWYEMSQIGHRLVFVVILVFIDSPSMQSSLATLVTIGLLMLHIYSRPYIDVVLDILHTFLQVALMIVILSGLVFYNPDVNDQDRFVMECFILVTLSAFGLIFIGFLARNVFEKLVHWYAQRRIGYVLGKSRKKLGDIDNVSELLHTFELRYLIPWVRHANNGELASLNELAYELAEYVSNESDTSYLSLTKTGRWWRFLSQRFPEVIDFLAVVDDENRAYFIKFVEVLYQYFFRYKGKNNIFEMINWQDRAAVAQWLALASDENRQLFNSIVKTSFQHAKGIQVAQDHFMRVVTYGRIQSALKDKATTSDRIMTRMGSSLNRRFSLKSMNADKLPKSLVNRVTDQRAAKKKQRKSFSERSSSILREIGKSVSFCQKVDVVDGNKSPSQKVEAIQNISQFSRKLGSLPTHLSTIYSLHNAEIQKDSPRDQGPARSKFQEEADRQEHQEELQIDVNEEMEDEMIRDDELLSNISFKQDLRLISRHGSGDSIVVLNQQLCGRLGPWDVKQKSIGRKSISSEKRSFKKVQSKT